MRGEKIGTLFHREANQWGCSKEATAREMAVAARDCSRHLQVFFPFTSFCEGIRQCNFQAITSKNNQIIACFLHVILNYYKGMSSSLSSKNINIVYFLAAFANYLCCMWSPKQKLSSEERKKILLDIADALEANEDLITSENQADLDLAQDIGYDKSLVARMTIKPGKVGQIHVPSSERCHL